MRNTIPILEIFKKYWGKKNTLPVHEIATNVVPVLKIIVNINPVRGIIEKILVSIT